jgi:hypothetical protein
MICDAPQRADCKGCKAHSGYYACERCVIRGTHFPRFGVRYLGLDKRLRRDAFWKNYLKREKGETVCTLFIINVLILSYIVFLGVTLGIDFPGIFLG